MGKRKNLSKAMFAIAMIVVSFSCSDDSSNNADSDDLSTATNIVSIKSAENDLKKILNDIEVQSTRAGANFPHRTVVNAFSVGVPTEDTAEASEPYYHVFNFENNQGFAIMSGDKRAPSLIALTDSGSYSKMEVEENPGLKLFLSKYEENYENIVNDSSLVKEVAYYLYGDYENVIYNYKGNCQVKWGTGSPYNMYCPEATESMFPQVV